MQYIFSYTPLAAALMGAVATGACAAEAQYTLEEIVVTAPRMAQPLTVVTDPTRPQQPAPANDGGAYLKNIPGFSLVRKGGTDGDPVLRGLAGSRLPILLDGMDFHGGCGMRMDPPTAYVFPETYDQVTVIKGPQTVAYGNGNSAGVVLFDHDRSDETPGHSVTASAMGGSWSRLDAVAGGKWVSEKGQLEATLTHAESGDYKDGAGVKVHSAYQRQSANLLAGLRLDANTRLNLDVAHSKAEAAYADRTMDGVKFDRDSVGAALERRNLSPLVRKLSARIYHSYIDHVMDNYSLRPLSGTASVSNPDRDTLGARVGADLDLANRTTLKLGADWRADKHTLRSATGSSAVNYTSLARSKDYESSFTGLFGEARHALDHNRSVIAGLRLDQWSGTRFNTTNGAVLGDDDRTLTSGFVRYEHLLSNAATAYVGLGHNERAMDYWEAVKEVGLTTGSIRNPEKTNQIDAGMLWQSDGVKGSVSAFYANVYDYILALSASSNKNIDASRYGLEGEMAYKLNANLTLRGNMAWVHADNDTDGVPLAQTPPLEVKLGADYKVGSWAYGGVLRMVARQDRIDPGHGTVVGLDRSVATPGFATLALNGSYKPNKQSLVSFGVDNVFDKNHYEHISRTDASVSGYTVDTTTAVNEPGRFIWAKFNYAL